MTATLHPWEQQSPEDKQRIINGLRERIAHSGHPAPNAPASPAALAAACDRRFKHRPHNRVIDQNLTWLSNQPDGKLMINTPPQVGKALALDTPIATPSDWTTMGELQVGDTVFDRHGEPCTVTGKSPVWDDRDCFTVRTGDGEQIVASAEHEWVARLDRRWGERIHDTRALARPRAKNAQITGPAGLNLPDADLPLHPYVLGYWLGDGSRGTANITTDDSWVVEHIRSLGYPCRPIAGNKRYSLTDGTRDRYRPSAVTVALRAVGVLNDKHVPGLYLRASEKQRLQLLQGLIDSDGHVTESGTVEFTNTNRRLADGVRELAYSLGAKATMHEGRAMLNGRDCGPKYRVKFMLADAAALPRKAERTRDSSVARIRYVWAEPTETVRTQCIEVDSPDHTYLAGRTMLPTHNSTIGARWFPAWWFTQHPRDAVVLGSYAAALATRHGAACREIIADHGAQYGLRLGKIANRNTWELTTGGSLDAAGIGGSLTGKSMDLGIIDDPHKDRAEAESPIIRQKVWDWYSGTFGSRRQPGTRELLIMTRWHQDDLAGRLLKEQGRVEDGGLWKVVHLPAIAVNEDKDRGFYPDPLGREAGEPLSHPKIPDGDTTTLIDLWTRRREVTTARDWNALYQGVPFDAEGALLTDDDLRDATVSTVAPALRVGVAVDPSGGGRDSAGIVAGQLGTDGKVTITHDRTGRMAANQWAEKACLLAVEVDADRIIVEKNYGGDIALDLVRLTWEKLQNKELVPADRLCPMIREVVARRNKVLRAEPVAAAVKSGRVQLMDKGLKQVKTEFTMWEPGSTWSPGALDAAVHLATELLQRPPRTTVGGSPRDRREVRGQTRQIPRSA